LKLLSVDVCGLAVQVMDSGSQRTVVYLFEVSQPCLAHYEHVLQFRGLVDARQLVSSSFRVFNRTHPRPTKHRHREPARQATRSNPSAMPDSLSRQDYDVSMRPAGRSIDLVGAAVRLRPTVLSDRPHLVSIRETGAVRERWRGNDLAAEFVADLEDEDVVRLTIETDADGIVGLIQFSEETDPDYRHASVDIYIDPAVHRRGYASDAIRNLVQYLFSERGHHRLTIDPAANNTAAIACYGAAGFTPVGVMRSYERQADGQWGDGLLMELVAGDYGRN